MVGADGKVEIRAVEPGERVGDLWVIEKGLKAGRAASSSAGLQYVRAGDDGEGQARVRDAAAAAAADPAR